VRRTQDFQRLTTAMTIKAALAAFFNRFFCDGWTGWRRADSGCRRAGPRFVLGARCQIRRAMSSTSPSEPSACPHPRRGVT